MNAFYTCPRCGMEHDVTDEVRHESALPGGIAKKANIHHQCACGGMSSIVLEDVSADEPGELWQPVMMTFVHK